jgi:hypothetical protein
VNALETSRRSRVCVGGIRPSASPGGYTIVDIRVRRGGRPMPDVRVHLAEQPGRGFAVIGIRRE